MPSPARRSSATATDIIFDGVVGQQIPDGLTQQQAVDALRASGQTQQADLLASLTVTGRRRLRGARATCCCSSPRSTSRARVFAWGQAFIMAGVSQRTVYRMRRDVDLKLSRLPLRYYDSHPRGDTLSRVTNDIDNIANSLQQTLTQLITALCTIIGVLAMMFWISPLLAVISLLTVPAVDRRDGVHREALAAAVRAAMGADRDAQRPRRGDAHRAQHRQGVRAPGRGDRTVRHGERSALPGELSSPVPVRDDPAGDAVHRQPELRGDLRHRRHPGGERRDEPR